MSESPLFQAPKFFKNVNFHKHTDRTVGWLELFYDLVYIATLIQIGNVLSDDVSFLGFAQFCVMMVVIWWAWTGETFYQNRYVVDDLMHRFLVFIQIFAVAAMGLSVSAAFGDLYVQFTLAYVVTRFMLVLMYIRSARAHPESKDLSYGYAAGFSIGIAIWLGSLLLPAEYHWVGWLIGITVELLVPFFPKVQRLQREWVIDLHHISERFSIFTIIVLGESFIKVLDDAQGSALTLDSVIFSIFGLLVLYSLWWLYFSDTADQLIDFDHPWKPFGWVYGHFPLVLGLVAFGVAAKKMFGSAIDYAGEPANPEYRILYTASIVLYLVALALIDICLDDDETIQNQRREAIVHVISMVIVVVIGLTMTGISATAFVALIAVIMVAQVIYSIFLGENASISTEAL